MTLMKKIAGSETSRKSILVGILAVANLITCYGGAKLISSEIKKDSIVKEKRIKEFKQRLRYLHEFIPSSGKEEYGVK